jgi:hypothetical protein
MSPYSGWYEGWVDLWDENDIIYEDDVVEEEE